MPRLPDLDRMKPDDVKGVGGGFGLRRMGGCVTRSRGSKDCRHGHRSNRAGMEDGTDSERTPSDKRSARGSKRPRNGGRKGSLRTADLTIHEEKCAQARGVARKTAGSRGANASSCRICGWRRTLRAIIASAIARPTGTLVTAPLPAGIVGHFGANLVRFVLQQYYECNVTEPKLLAQLHAFGIKISLAALSNLLIEGKAAFHAEEAGDPGRRPFLRHGS